MYFNFIASSTLKHHDIQICLQHVDNFRNFIDECNLPSSYRPYLRFLIDNISAFVYYFNGDFRKTRSILSKQISSAPSINGVFLSGFVDSLLMLSEAHSQLGRHEDALHSARLAVTIAHRRIDFHLKVSLSSSLTWYFITPCCSHQSSAMIDSCFGFAMTSRRQLNRWRPPHSLITILLVNSKLIHTNNSR